MVDGINGLQKLSIVTNLAGSTLKCLNILWKTTTAIPTPRIYKMVTDTRIGTYALANLLDISTEKFSNIGQFKILRELQIHPPPKLKYDPEWLREY